MRPDTVELTSIGWTLKTRASAYRRDPGQTLIPVYKIKARFLRSSKPPRPAVPRPTQRPPKPLWTRELHRPFMPAWRFDPARNRIIERRTAGT